jgi:predicted Zn-ribbon and HTH transcriptional regulator
MSTRRESIEKLLETTEVPLTARDICERLGISGTSELFDDIEHISQTIRIQGKEILIRPARCGKCGYVFWDRHVAKVPAKCPKCHSEHIIEPGYIIQPGK